jgi:hypothetical protein
MYEMQLIKVLVLMVTLFLTACAGWTGKVKAQALPLQRCMTACAVECAAETLKNVCKISNE